VSLDRQKWSLANRVKGLAFAKPQQRENLSTAAVIVIPVQQRKNQNAVVVPGYHIHAIIGSGGCGVVYRAEQLKLKRVVALKMVTLKQGTATTALARFEQEAMALAKLQHPNIVNVFDYGHLQGQVFMTMELLEGEDLEQRIKRLGRLDERTVWTIVRQVAVALAYAAKISIIHRDIKPANLFLTPAPSGIGLPKDMPMVKVMDFGLAFVPRDGSQADDLRLTQQGNVVGTPAYMAPEQFADSDVDFRADIYALGATVFHGLTGKLPFDGLSIWDLMIKKAESTPKFSRDVVSECSAKLVADMMAPKLTNRIPDYEELVRRIDALPCMANRVPERKPSRNRRRWTRPIAVSAIVAVFAFLTVMLVKRPYSTGPVAVSGLAPSVTTSGRIEVLSDRENFSSWTVNGRVVFETGTEEEPVLAISGEVRWPFRSSASERLSLGIDLNRAETVEILFADIPTTLEGVGLRISRTEGVTVGRIKNDGEFSPLSTTVPFPRPEQREGLVPYLNVELQHVGKRWDVWFEQKHLGGFRVTQEKSDLRVRSDGRAARIERVELERLQLPRP